MAEILLYGSINSECAAEFIEEVNEARAEDANCSIDVRVNTPGGEPEYTWGIISKFAEVKGSKTVKVDGQAHSMGAFLCCYAENVEALDVAEFLIHRVAYPTWFEGSPDYFTEPLRGNLERINKSLQKALEARIDVAKFESMKGVSIKDIFSMDGRKDVYLTAKEAKQVGLIDKIIKITPEKRAEVEALKSGRKPVATASSEKTNQNQYPMTLEQLKAQHPDVYAAALKLGQDQERERCEAWAYFAEVDGKSVNEGIKSGKAISQVQIIEMADKKAASRVLGGLEKESAQTVVLTAAEKEEATKKAEQEAAKKKAEQDEFWANFKTFTVKG